MLKVPREAEERFMRMDRWVWCAAAVAMMGSGALAEQACGGAAQTPSFTIGDASGGPPPGSGNSGSSGSGSSGDSGPMCGGPTLPFTAGDGGACAGPVGGYPAATCDPSDETAPVCMTPGTYASCNLSQACGDLTTCEPFTTNPCPGTGVDNFRMRLINLTAPAKLANPTVQAAVVTAGVDLPAVDGGNCGEDGMGTFNWLISVDQKTSTVTTGGAPASSDPFNVGYCYVNGNVNGTPIAPVTLSATFTGSTFSTAPKTGVLQIPIFVAGGGAVILPIYGGAFHDVDVSNGGQCIGQINNGSISVNNKGVCVDPRPAGVSSCSRWHAGGTLGGYIPLAVADKVPVVSLGNESLCVLLTGQQAAGSSPPTCPMSAYNTGDYDSKTGQASPSNTGDSFWLSAQFAASAVKVVDGGVPVCSGGSVGSTDGG
jgi:hypothetical protein